MRIQTQGNSNKVWLSSDEGVINNTMILSAPTVEKILQAVNEKYGTSLEDWSQLPTAYEVGDNVPNWNAYEKIEIPRTYIAVTNGGDEGPFAFGELKDNDEIVFECFEENVPCIANTDGVLVQKQYGFPQVFTNLWKPKIDAALGINSTASTIISSLNLGETVPNWSKYQKIV